MSTGLTITVVVPRPPRILHPNGRTRSYMARAKKAKAYRRTCGFLAIQALELVVPPMWERAKYSAVFFVRDQRGMKQDEDNAGASLKHCMDAMADAGIVKNDRGFVRDSLKFEINPARAGTVEISIWEAK